jgi:hypoxanthine phosphoribosyltransferase
MNLERPAVLFPEDRIRERLAELGGSITASFEGCELCVVARMKSCLVFMADLIRVIRLDTVCHFLTESALPGGGGGAERTDISYSTEALYEGRHVLLIEDVVDTGITLNFLLDHIRDAAPASLKVCALVDKPGRRKVDVALDWAAFTLEEEHEGFLVGYGLDLNEHYRGLPYIGTIPRPVAPSEGSPP